MGQCWGGHLLLYAVFLSHAAQKEIRSWPLPVRKDVGSLLTKLQKGHMLSMPEVRAMPVVSKGCYEARIQSPDGSFRFFYLVKTKTGVVVFHAFQKKTQKTPLQDIETGRRRLNQFLKELTDEKDN